MDKSVFTLICIGIIVLICMMGVFGLAKNRLEDSITNKVMQKIKQEYMRDYVPGPYTPGFDPDKVGRLSSLSHEDVLVTRWEDNSR